MDRVDVSSLEACERDFRKAAKMLAAMLEPPSGKVSCLPLLATTACLCQHVDEFSVEPSFLTTVSNLPPSLFLGEI